LQCSEQPGIGKRTRKDAAAPCSWALEKSQVESAEHQDNADIHYQPFPESVPEEREIHTDYDGRHRQYVKHDSDLSAHLGHSFNRSTDNPWDNPDHRLTQGSGNCGQRWRAQKRI
jgi:hypothetical protein